MGEHLPPPIERKRPKRTIDKSKIEVVANPILPDTRAVISTPTHPGEFSKGTLFNHLLSCFNQHIPYAIEMNYVLNYDRYNDANGDLLDDLVKVREFFSDIIKVQNIARRLSKLRGLEIGFKSVKEGFKGDIFLKEVLPILDKYKDNAVMFEILQRAIKNADNVALSFIDISDEDFDPEAEGYLNTRHSSRRFDLWRTIGTDYARKRLEGKEEESIVMLSDSDITLSSEVTFDNIYKYFEDNPEIDMFVIPETFSLSVESINLLDNSPENILRSILHYIEIARGPQIVFRTSTLGDIDSIRNYSETSGLTEDYATYQRLAALHGDKGVGIFSDPKSPPLGSIRFRDVQGTVDSSGRQEGGSIYKLSGFDSVVGDVLQYIDRIDARVSEIAKVLLDKAITFYDKDMRDQLEDSRLLARLILSNWDPDKGVLDREQILTLIEDYNVDIGAIDLYLRSFSQLLKDLTQDDINYLDYLVNDDVEFPFSEESNLTPLQSSFREFFGTYIPYGQIVDFQGEEFKDKRSAESKYSILYGVVAGFVAHNLVDRVYFDVPDFLKNEEVLQEFRQREGKQDSNYMGTYPDRSSWTDQIP